jgi:hypothetical protein
MQPHQKQARKPAYDITNHVLNFIQEFYWKTLLTDFYWNFESFTLLENN